MKIRYLIILLLLVAFPCSAGMIIQQFTNGGDSYSDIIFYHDCEALDDANKSGGSAVVTYQNTVTSTPYILGNSWYFNSETYWPFRFETLGNADYESGVLGFYYQPIEAWSNGSWLTNDDLAGTGTYLREDTATLIEVEYHNSGLSQLSTSFVTDQLYYVMMVFNNDEMDIFVYTCTNPSTCNTTPDWSIENVSEGAASVGANVVFGNTGAIATRDGYLDQIMFSNDPTRDLLLIRNVTTITD